jgi:hypothetical protein
MRYELWNYRTAGYDDVYDWNIANLHDYIPQSYEYQAMFKTNLMNGEDPRKSAMTVLINHHDRDFVDFYKNHGGRKAMMKDPAYQLVAQNLSMVNMMISEKLRNRGWGMLSGKDTELPIYNYSQVRFQKEKIGVVMIDEGYFYHDPKIVVHNGLVKIWDFVWRAPESALYQEITYPEDWWQAFKERWFPDWLKEKYPIKYTKVVIDVWELYPTLQPALPDHQPILQMMKVDY